MSAKPLPGIRVTAEDDATHIVAGAAAAEVALLTPPAWLSQVVGSLERTLAAQSNAVLRVLERIDKTLQTTMCGGESRGLLVTLLWTCAGTHLSTPLRAYRPTRD